ncbi:MAG: urea carboxylase-associated family protein [Pseudomonadota bacterium]
MDVSEEILIQGGAADGLLLAEGDQFRITNLEGSQVVDLWAFVQPDIAEYLSTEHTRSCLQKLVPGVGDTLYTNQRRPVLTMVEDTSPGVHDMLLSACDERRYELLGHDGYHKNCADNLRHITGENGHTLEDVPSPFNIFERVDLDEKGALSIQPPLAKAGDFITLRADLPILVVLSACPMDMALTNGPDMQPKPVLVQRLA